MVLRPPVAFRDRLVAATQALLGVTEHALNARPIGGTLDLEDDVVQRIRQQHGGQLQPLPVTRTRWFLADLETAQVMADRGDMTLAAQLCASMRRDGMIGGLLKTRTSGLVALPKRWRGHAEAIEALKAENGTRSVFDEMFPPSELALLAADGITVGVGVGELCKVPGRDYPILQRLSPEFLRYRWNDGKWIFRSVAGDIEINPGDGRWVLHTPGGLQAPWQSGIWPALGRAFIGKEHALLHRANYIAKLANPARVAHSPSGAETSERAGFLSQLIAWGINTVIELPPGWEADLLESNGVGWEVFGKEIETSDLESMISLAGQVVTVTGGTGFANADIHKTIRADLIKETAEALSQTICAQGIPAWAYERFGEDTLKECPRFVWDTDPPEDRDSEAKALEGFGKAIIALTAALAPYGLQPNITEIAQRYGVPVEQQAEAVKKALAAAAAANTNAAAPAAPETAEPAGAADAA